MLAKEPGIKRAIAFFDGQNLYHCAREAFGYGYPNYDPSVLAQAICTAKGWSLVQVSFYTGSPDYHDPFWANFWQKKLLAMSRKGVRTFRRKLRYRPHEITLDDGTVKTVEVGEEKGIDVRIAIDVIRLAIDGAYDVALIFSQDQDLSEAADEVRKISIKFDRWLAVASAYPVGSGTHNKRGIDRTEWIPVDKATYDTCLDPNDYR